MLYQAFCTAWMLSSGRQKTNKLEVIQNRVGRLALGSNRMVGVEAIRGDMGWSSFSAGQDKKVQQEHLTVRRRLASRKPLIGQDKKVQQERLTVRKRLASQKPY